MTVTPLDHFKQFIFDAESGTQYANWAKANKLDLGRWQQFRDNVRNGRRPLAVPTMTTPHGRELIDAAVIYLDTLAAPTPAPVPAPTTLPPPSIAGELRLGDPAKGFDANSHTSTGWTRQAGVPDHVSFSQEKWFGDWQVINCLIKPGDPVEWSGQRAQIINGAGSLLPVGVPKWISVPFRTNAGYKPQSQSLWPQWNAIGMCLHESNDFYAYPGGAAVKTTSPQAPFAANVVLKDPNLYPYVTLPQAHLAFYSYGGVPDKDWYSKGRRWLGPVFVPGHLYVLDVGVLLSSDPAKGELEVWLDGVQVVPRTKRATTWKNLAGVDVPLFFNLENYRPATPEITWDNVISWCGVRIADTREEATFLA